MFVYLLWLCRFVPVWVPLLVGQSVSVSVHVHVLACSFVRSFFRSHVHFDLRVRERSLSQVHFFLFFCLGKNESKAGQITRKEESVALRTQRAFVSSARCIVRFKWQSVSTARCSDRLQVQWNAYASQSQSQSQRRCVAALSLSSSSSLSTAFACKSRRCGHTFKWPLLLLLILLPLHAHVKQ